MAAAARTQAPTIYRLFGDKEGLLHAVAEYGFASYLAAKPVPQPGSDPVQDLRAGWDLHISFGLDHPDYLGLGTGPGLHPWMDVPSETTAALDMLRASRSYVTGHGRTLRHQVFATGFS